MNPSKRLFQTATVAALIFCSINTSTHAAAGIGIAWNHCQGEAGAAQNRTFACDTNAGTEVAYGTFVLAAPITQLAATDASMQLVAAAPVLPAWWQLGGGSCRFGSLTTQPIPDPTATLCQDWAQGVGNGNATVFCTSSSVFCLPPAAPNIATFLIGTFVAQELGQDVDADQLYFTFSMHLNHAKTFGLGSCAGCATPVCITLTKLTLTQIGGNSTVLTNASIPGGNVITWLGGVPGVPMCLAATSTRQSTWGSVKSLYR